MLKIKKEKGWQKKFFSIEEEENVYEDDFEQFINTCNDDDADDILCKLGFNNNDDNKSVSSDSVGEKLTTKISTNYPAEIEFSASFEEEFIKNYDDDDNADDILRKLRFNNNEDNRANSNKSVSSDSVGEKLDTKVSSNYPADLEFSSFEEDEADGTAYYGSFDDDGEACSLESKFSFQIFNQAIDEIQMTKQKKFKNGTRSSLTFSNERVKEIQRDNHILLSKIMRNGPAIGDDNLTKKEGFSFNKERPLIKSAAEINRRRKQQKIEYENQILKRKLEKISSRRRPMSNTLA